MNAENVAFLPLNISSSQQATGVGDGVCVLVAVLVGVAVFVGVAVNVGQGVPLLVLVGVFDAVLLGVGLIKNLVILII